MSKIQNILELILVTVGGLSVPVLVLCYYFNVIPRSERSQPLAILFLIITLIYVPICFYLS